MAFVPRISTSGDTARRTAESLINAIFALRYDVPSPPTMPAVSSPPVTRGTVALNCTRFVSPNAASTIGKSTSLIPLPDQRIADTVSIDEPGSSRLASSTHESGDAPVAVESGEEPLTVLAGLFVWLKLTEEVDDEPWEIDDAI